MPVELSIRKTLKFFYRAFGLVIESQFECPELLPETEQSAPDVRILTETMPEHSDEISSAGNRVEGDPQRLLLRIAGVACFLIRDGREIKVYPCPDASFDDIRLYLLGSAMGAMLHQRGMLPFHGSSICVDNRAITFSGPSGIGKSTLAAALVTRGYRMLADDVSAISFADSGLPMVNPGMPQLKLCDDVGRKLGYNPLLARSLGNHAEKHGYPEHTAFVSETTPSKAVYILGRHADNRFEDISLTGIDKFMALKDNTYRPSFVKVMGIERIHFDLLRKLAECIEVHILLRPVDGFRINELADYVSRLISK